MSVSYTHLDVYKRQLLIRSINFNTINRPTKGLFYTFYVSVKYKFVTCQLMEIMLTCVGYEILPITHDLFAVHVFLTTRYKNTFTLARQPKPSRCGD